MAAHGGARLGASDKRSLHLDLKNSRSYSGSGSTIYDIGLYGRNSTITGPTFNSEGSLSFAGQGERDGDPAGDYISVNNTSTLTSLAAKPDGCTYSWWMMITGTQTNGHSLLFGSSTINHLEWRNGYFRTEARLQNGYSFGSSSTTMNNDVWYNISIVFANDESGRPVRWYKNGELFHSHASMESGSGGTGEYFQPYLFGRSTGTAAYLYAQSFKGKLGQFIVWDRTLTADEVLDNYTAMRGRYAD